MKTIVIMRGLPGSGKSTAIETIVAEEKNVAVLSTDDIFMSGTVSVKQAELLSFRIVAPMYLWTADGLRHAHALNRLKCEVTCERNIDMIVIDNTNTTWKEIKDYVAIADNYNYRVELHSASTSWCMDVDECYKKNTHDVPLDAIKRMKERWVDDGEIKTLCGYHFPDVECLIS